MKKKRFTTTETIQLESTRNIESVGRWDSWYGDSGFYRIGDEIVAVTNVHDDHSVDVIRATKAIEVVE